MTIVEKYKKEHKIDKILDDLWDFDSYSYYQGLLKEMIDFIELLEELLNKQK